MNRYQESGFKSLGRVAKRSSQNILLSVHFEKENGIVVRDEDFHPVFRLLHARDCVFEKQAETPFPPDICFLRAVRVGGRG